MSGFTYSHSSLSSFRRCPRKYFLSYDLRLTPLADREALTVGSCWHESFEQPEGTEFYSWFYANAPSELWAEKLYRLHAAHRAIYEGREGFEVVEVEARSRMMASIHLRWSTKVFPIYSQTIGNLIILEREGNFAHLGTVFLTLIGFFTARILFETKTA